MEEKKDYEEMPFFLVPRVSYFPENQYAVSEDFKWALGELKEEKEKTELLMELFKCPFESFEKLKERMKGLEKLANMIKMQPPSFQDFGVINYERREGDRIVFSYYRLIRQRDLLDIIRMDWERIGKSASRE